MVYNSEKTALLYALYLLSDFFFVIIIPPGYRESDLPIKVEKKKKAQTLLSLPQRGKKEIPLETEIKK